MPSLETLNNVRQFEPIAREKLSPADWEFLAGAADDGKTLAANEAAFDRWGIRARRMVDVASVDTSVELLGETLASPLYLCPIGFQGQMHAEGEVASARGAGAGGHLMIASTVTTFSYADIAAATTAPLWFQLYPTSDRTETQRLIEMAEKSGARVLVLTVDVPVLGNRESQAEFLRGAIQEGTARLGNFGNPKDLQGLGDASLTWEVIPWIRERTDCRLVLKGIVAAEDAERSLRAGVDGIVVSNHGGRQEESGLGTLDCLPEVVEAAGRVPVLFDGGVRRGTDAFKALALGAKAVGVGRPYVWGLSAFGQPGVERVMRILDEELVRIMQLAGVPRIGEIKRESVRAI